VLSDHIVGVRVVVSDCRSLCFSITLFIFFVLVSDYRSFVF